MLPSDILSPLWIGYALSAGLGTTIFGAISEARARRRALLMMVLVVAALAVAGIEFPTEAYLLYVVAIVAAGNLAAFGLGVLWGWLARRLGRRLLGAAGRRARPAGVALALAPSLVAAGVLIEAHRVPNAPCAERALLSFGQLGLAVPRQLGSVIRADGWSGIYSTTGESKGDVIAYCRRSDNGRTPLEAERLWASGGLVAVVLGGRSCGGGAGPGATPAACEAVRSGTLSSLELHAARGLPERVRDGLGDPGPDDRTGGDTANGHHCRDVPTRDAQACALWRQVSPGVIAIARTDGRDATDETLLADAEAAIGFTLEALAGEATR